MQMIPKKGTVQAHNILHKYPVVRPTVLQKRHLGESFTKSQKYRVDNECGSKTSDGGSIHSTHRQATGGPSLSFIIITAVWFVLREVLVGVLVV